MSVTNVRSRWVDGNLVFYDSSGAIICTFDGTNRALTFPSGSTLNLPDGNVEAADIALAEGSVVVGNNAGAGVALDASTTTQFLVGNGTTLASVAMSNDATMDNTGAVTISSGAVDRAMMATEVAHAGYGVYVRDILQTTGIPIVPAEVAGNFNLSLSANVLLIQGEVCDNETELSEGSFQFRLPAEYVDGGTITVTLPAALIATAAGNDNGSTLDLECFKSDGAGAVGADICATAAETFVAMDTWYDKAFTITPTGVVSGDLLNFVITANVVDDEAGGGTLRMTMEVPQVTLDVKG